MQLLHAQFVETARRAQERAQELFRSRKRKKKRKKKLPKSSSTHAPFALGNLRHVSSSPLPVCTCSVSASRLRSTRNMDLPQSTRCLVPEWIHVHVGFGGVWEEIPHMSYVRDALALGNLNIIPRLPGIWHPLGRCGSCLVCACATTESRMIKSTLPAHTPHTTITTHTPPPHPHLPTHTHKRRPRQQLQLPAPGKLGRKHRRKTNRKPWNNKRLHEAPVLPP